MTRFFLLTSPWVIAALAACSSADAPEDGAQEQTESNDALFGFGAVSCNGTYNDAAVRDARNAEQTFDIEIAPGAAAELGLLSTWETFTATVTPAEGGTPRTVVSYPIGSPEDEAQRGNAYALIGNTSAAKQKYHVTIRRSTAAHDHFNVRCSSIAKDPKTPSGVGDRSVCIDGNACVQRTPAGLQSGRCSAAFYANVADPARGGQTIGTCRGSPDGGS